MDIKELEITKEMYLEAKKDRDFRKKYGDHFDTWEIVKEYERRETNTDRLLTKDQNVYRFTYLNDTTREFKFFSCYLDKENGKLYTLANNIYGNSIPGVFDVTKIKNVECIERNNNLDYQ